MEMFKYILKGIGIALVALLGCAILIATCFIFLCGSMGSQKLISKSSAPDEKHTVYVYLRDGGATTSWKIVCDIKGSHILGKRRIYVKDDINTATVTWLDDRTVKINGITLDIYRDKYPDPG